LGSHIKILFIHQNFPGQFVHLSREMAERGHEVRALAITGREIKGVKLENYKLLRSSTKGIHSLAGDFETKMIRAESCSQKMVQYAKEGFIPDLIVAHPGWGESLFCKDIFPQAKLVHFVEFHYGKCLDTNFDQEFKNTDPNVISDYYWRIRSKDASNLMALDSMDMGLTPTKWQLSSVPEYAQKNIEVVFDGVDTDALKPDPEAFVTVKNAAGKQDLKAGDEVLTFINRNLEPYRGYHSFMRALPAIMKARPNARVVIVGGDDVSYSSKPPAGKTWKQLFLDEVKDQLDMSRIYFVGKIPYPVFIKLMQVTRCHLYLTYPFVLSWSCVEALSAGALVVGSRTPPVEEFIQDKKTGLLVDFFDYQQIAKVVIDCLANPQKYDAIRKAARQSIIKNYDLKTVCLPRQLSLLKKLLGRTI